MKIVEGTELPGDPRKRPLRNTARIDVVIYLDVPDSEIRKMPGYKQHAIDLAREKIAESSSVGELLNKVQRYSAGAIVRASGR
jgi:hypothetical protein